MNKAKPLDIIARKQQEILNLTERLHVAGHETTLTQIGNGSAVMVFVRRQVADLGRSWRSSPSGCLTAVRISGRALRGRPKGA